LLHFYIMYFVEFLLSPKKKKRRIIMPLRGLVNYIYKHAWRHTIYIADISMSPWSQEFPSSATIHIELLKSSKHHHHYENNLPLITPFPWESIKFAHTITIRLCLPVTTVACCKPYTSICTAPEKRKSISKMLIS